MTPAKAEPAAKTGDPVADLIKRVTKLEAEVKRLTNAGKMIRGE